MSIGRGNKPEKLVVRDPAHHIYLLLIELIISRWAALSWFVSESGAIPVFNVSK